MKNLKSFKENNRFDLNRLPGLPILASFLFAGLLISNSGFAQAPNPPESYICFQPDEKIVIDGKLNEKSWKKAEWTSKFKDIEGDKKPLPLQDTRVKMLWDNEFLYIAAVLDEEHIWAYQDKKDQIVFHENDFEVFIDPDGDTENYYELEINAINNTFDLFLPKTYKKGGKAQISWNIEGLKSAVSIDGTLNDGKDKDKSWTLEIAIPFQSLANDKIPAIIPVHDAVWRINFSRVNWQHEIGTDGKYSRRKNKETNKLIPEYNWVWSPQGIINMHFPEYWGYLHFNAGSVGRKQSKSK
ncbi:carbohydrate-binding family 9-like protein [Dyadobacter flavalbus]|uniref:carbohydrate-binding family 9-like protein n=1 Tax=Dyadobacter flavalbus TaxID=2579942 RepID=UPI001E54D407|nr:carbohydrate-binding family 9-like protein [Dyadobacter flavalbus]